MRRGDATFGVAAGLLLLAPPGGRDHHARQARSDRDRRAVGRWTLSDGVRGAEVRRPRRAERPFRGLLLIATLFSPAFAYGAEPSGCDKFKWPLAHERSALSATDLARLEPGATLSFDAAASVRLVPLAEAKLAMAPERAPKASPSWAGAI